jgi:hypothetical protein
MLKAADGLNPSSHQTPPPDCIDAAKQSVDCQASTGMDGLSGVQTHSSQVILEFMLRDRYGCSLAVLKGPTVDVGATRTPRPTYVQTPCQAVNLFDSAKRASGTNAAVR